MGTFKSLTLVAFGPLFLGPLNEIFGRVRVLQFANLFLWSSISLVDSHKTWGNRWHSTYCPAWVGVRL